MTTTATAKSDTQTPLWQIALGLLLLGLTTFGLPYFFPVTPSISLSYEAGFNNRVAFVCFALGCLLFALFLRRDLGIAQADSTLRRPALYFALAIALVSCMARPAFTGGVTAGSEVTYLLNRQYLLASGLIPYRQFEFAYGPLLLYPGVWISRILHVSLTTGYYLWWTATWLIGVKMAWELVNAIDIATRHRNQIFALVCAMVCPAISTEGVSYSPMRFFSGAFVVLTVHRICWRRGAPLWTAAAAVLGVTFALGCSAEQGIGAAAGLTIYFAYLAFRKNPVVSWVALAVMLLGFAGVFAAAEHLAVFTTMHSFASGGNSFPLLATPWTCILLGAYVCAACLVVQRVREGNETSVILPLVCAGAAMLPSAFGRCDLGHIASAWPAMLVGIFAIYSIPAMFRWWVPVMWLFLVLPGDLYGAKLFARSGRDAAEYLLIGAGGAPTGLQSFVRSHLERRPSMKTRLDAMSSKLALRERLDNPGAPCDLIYLAPAYGRMLGPCVDGGYYLGQANLFLPAQIQQKIGELIAHPEAPLLLPDRPLHDTFPVHLDNMAMLCGLEGPCNIPAARNPPISLAPLAQYISEHYVREKLLEGTGYAVWEPK